MILSRTNNDTAGLCALHPRVGTALTHAQNTHARRGSRRTHPNPPTHPPTHTYTFSSPTHPSANKLPRGHFLFWHVARAITAPPAPSSTRPITAPACPARPTPLTPATGLPADPTLTPRARRPRPRPRARRTRTRGAVSPPNRSPVSRALFGLFGLLSLEPSRRVASRRCVSCERREEGASDFDTGQEYRARFAVKDKFCTCAGVESFAMARNISPHILVWVARRSGSAARPARPGASP
jgi:hypothetical protein